MIMQGEAGAADKWMSKDIDRFNLIKSGSLYSRTHTHTLLYASRRDFSCTNVTVWIALVSQNLSHAFHEFLQATNCG